MKVRGVGRLKASTAPLVEELLLGAVSVSINPERVWSARR